MAGMRPITVSTAAEQQARDRRLIETLQRDLAHARAQIAALETARDAAVRACAGGRPWSDPPVDRGRVVKP